MHDSVERLDQMLLGFANNLKLYGKLACTPNLLHGHLKEMPNGFWPHKLILGLSL